MAKSTFDSNNSAYEKYLENTFMNVPRSRHDLSHVHTGQTTFGIIAPVLCLETMPNEDIDLNLTASIQLRNPTPRPLINGCRVYFHAYYNRCRDLWEGFENFVTHGRRQDVQLSKPNLIYSSDSAAAAGLSHPGFDFVYNSHGTANACTPLSLMDFMGIPSQRLQKTFGFSNPASNLFSPLRSFQACIDTLSNDPAHTPVLLPDDVSSDVLSESPSFIDALPFVAYQRNWRDFYSPKNLLMNNINWFPDNENEWLLPYECPNAAVLSHSDPVTDRPLNAIVVGMATGTLYHSDYWSSYYTETPEPYNPDTVSASGDYLNQFMPVLCAIKFRSFSGDRFTSGSPFADLVRGSIPSLEAFVTSGSLLAYRNDGSVLGRMGSQTTQDYSSFGSGSIEPQLSDYPVDGYNEFIFNSSPLWYLGLNPAAKISVTQNDLRKLETITVLRERLARTDGDYSDMIGALFGERPSKESHEGIYIGGCYQDVVFSSVTQTSQSTVDSQLGDKAGQGYSVSNGRIGHFHSDDYGWIQVYMSIVPETYYPQGLDAQFSRDVADKMWNPLMSNMPPQAVLNKEIFVSGDPSVDELPFSYEQRGNEYRSRRNRVSGFSALSHSEAVYDTSIVMSRRFEGTPSFNSKFLAMTPENIDMDVFSYNDEPPFDFSVGFDLSVVLPMPSVSVPGAMSSNLHA